MEWIRVASVLLALASIGVQGYMNPNRKTWWTKRLSDGFHAAGRLSARQLKYVGEAGEFKTVISMYTNEENVGNINAPGGTYFPKTTTAKEIVEDNGMTFHTLLTVEESKTKAYKTVEVLKRLHMLFRSSPKPILYFCGDSSGGVYMTLAHFMNVTKHSDNKDYEPEVSHEDLFRISAEMGYNFGEREAFKTLAEQVSTTSLDTYPVPDVAVSKWNELYWEMKPVYGNMFVGGQIQKNDLERIGNANIKTIANVRLGVTKPPNNTPSQEEVTLLNIKDATGTYTGAGRQTTTELEKNVIDSMKPNTYISATSQVNYESRNPLEFGDDIGHNDTVEKNAIKEVLPDVTYLHIPIGGQYKYSAPEAMWGAFEKRIDAAIELGPALFHCRTGTGASLMGIFSIAHKNCKSSKWAVERGKQLGYDISKYQDKMNFYETLLDNRKDCSDGTSAAGATTASYLTVALVLGVIMFWH